MFKLECVLTDVCLPDYFSNDSRPWVTIPVFKGMTLKEIAEGNIIDAEYKEINDAI